MDTVLWNRWTPCNKKTKIRNEMNAWMKRIYTCFIQKKTTFIQKYHLRTFGALSTNFRSPVYERANLCLFTNKRTSEASEAELLKRRDLPRNVLGSG